MPETLAAIAEFGELGIQESTDETEKVDNSAVSGLGPFALEPPAEIAATRIDSASEAYTAVAEDFECSDAEAIRCEMPDPQEA